MTTLVDYSSSDEGDESHSSTIADTEASQNSSKTIAASTYTGSEQRSQQKTTSSISTTPLGPVLGPSNPIPMDDGDESETRDLLPPSPYSSNSAMLRDLTLPTAPSYEIPPSPPGSPVASTNSKFKHFLNLKKKNIHFNEKLSHSVALKNPGLMQKLMDFSDIDEGNQYATTIPPELWNPSGFPDLTYKEGLLKNQQDILKKREEKFRGSVDFVPAAVSNESSKSDASKVAQKSAAERIMAGLDRGRSSSPHVQGTKRKTRFEG